MGFTEPQYREMLHRVQRNSGREPPQPEPELLHVDAVDAELPLHAEFMKWCKAQFPQVPFCHTNPSKASRATPGAPDFFVCYKGRIVALELKDKDGKLSKDQQVWHKLSEMQGVKVYVCRSLSEILKALNEG